LKKGDTVGYEATYTAKGDETIAVIACGWADGFQRIFSKGSIYINNRLYPIVGKISMDSLTVKVDKNVKVGDRAILIRDLNHAVSMLEDKTDVANVVAALCGITARVKIVAVNK
jgi:alanine racemase